MPDKPPDGLPCAGAFFGRRKGKALRPHQSQLMRDLLPQLRLPLDCPAPERLADLFAVSVSDIHLEIGFGGGEHLVQRARENPSIGFIGCEAFVNGLAKTLAEIDRHKLANIRLWDDDAKQLLQWLPNAQIGRVYVLYPDPWPKRRHRKRRFLNEAMLPRLAAAMRPGAELCFATDIDDYSATVLAQITTSADFVWTAARAIDWQTPWPGWHSTRYEKKALREGRTPTYLTLRRV